MDILRDDIGALYRHYLAAAFGSAIIEIIFAGVDSLMVGKYHGPAGIAAIAITAPLAAIIFSFGILTAMGGSILYANRRGRATSAGAGGDLSGANEWFSVSVIFGALLSAIALGGMLLWEEPLLRFFGADDSVLPIAHRYMLAAKFSMPCVVFGQILQYYLRNDGNPTLAAKAVLIAGVCNAIGDYLLVFALDMGAFGAGLATAGGLTLSMLIMLTHFASPRHTLRLVRPADIASKVRRVLVTGFPAAVNDLAMGVFTVLFNRQIMHYFDVNVLAVFGVIVQLLFFVQCTTYSAGLAAQPIISQNFGARQFDRVRRCTFCGLRVVGAFTVVVVAAVMAWPTLFLHIYTTPTPELLALAPPIMRAYATSFLLLPFNIFASYYFQSTLQTRLANFGTLARGFVLSGLMVVMLPRLFGADALWLAMLATELLVALACARLMWPQLKATDH